MKRFPFSTAEIAVAVLIGALFLLAAHFSTTYTEVIEQYASGHDVTGPFLYILSAIIATVIAPVSATPLIPIASTLWGPNVAAIYSVIGWTIGTGIAFWIARRYGFSRVAKIVQLKKVQQYAAHIPKKNVFWSVVLMRIILPVDILSYALGLFSNMTFGSYILATIIGITPFAFVFSYAVHLPTWVQVALLATIGAIVAYGYTAVRKTVTRGD